jgi:geranylgeranyl diphosphate synthase type I
MLKEELELNAERISQLIGEDDFPVGIKPTFLRNAVLDYPLRGGKHLRSALLSWTCGLFGGNIESAKFAAAAVEIYHNWTLVHDDIIDNDILRRNKPSTHVDLANFAKKQYQSEHSESEKFGRDFAILTGDLQQGWSLNMLMKSIESGVSETAVLYLSRNLQEMVNRRLISGEALDVEFCYCGIDTVTKEKVEQMLYYKTGVLLEFCAMSGAVIALDSNFPGGASPKRKLEVFENDERIEKIAKFASKAGIAFQLRDDWLGIFGEEKVLGKPVASDIVEGKPTIILMEALQKLPQSEKDELSSYIGRKDISDKDICEIRRLVRKSGAEEVVDTRSNKLLEEAKELISGFDENHYKSLLIKWADFLIKREL